MYRYQYQVAVVYRYLRTSPSLRTACELLDVPVWQQVQGGEPLSEEWEES
jgi:hypothetical protein